MTSFNASNDFQLSNLSEEDIKKKLLNLDNSKAAGIDQISEGRCRSINSSPKTYNNKFIDKPINNLRRVQNC